MSAQPRITIRLQGNGRTFPPGGTLRGEYWVEDADPEDIKAVELSVLWYTEGKGEEDLSIHLFRRDTLDQLLHAEGRWIGRFETVLPRTPWSYDGLVVKIIWCVRVRIFLARGKQVVEELRFRLGSASAPKGIPK